MLSVRLNIIRTCCLHVPSLLKLILLLLVLFELIIEVDRYYNKLFRNFKDICRTKSPCHNILNRWVCRWWRCLHCCSDVCTWWPCQNVSSGEWEFIFQSAQLSVGSVPLLMTAMTTEKKAIVKRIKRIGGFVVFDLDPLHAKYLTRLWVSLCPSTFYL